jgi:hypothetical protein
MSTTPVEKPPVIKPNAQLLDVVYQNHDEVECYALG